jgi:hypothetical protein
MEAYSAPFVSTSVLSKQRKEKQVGQLRLVVAEWHFAVLFSIVSKLEA